MDFRLKSLIEHSRKEYTANSGTATEGEIKAGALQRIANALEGINQRLGVIADTARIREYDHQKLMRANARVKKLRAELKAKS